jgi:NDP-sugar pyrophosphorylase family protein
MKALILAAGFGIRLREIFHGRPKHLIPINGQPFLHHLISLLRRNEIRDIVVAVGYLSDHIIHEVGDGRKLGVKVDYSIDDRPLGTAGTVKHAEHFFNDDFFVINGDTYLDIDYQRIFKFHKEHLADVTLVGTTKRSIKGGLIQVRKNTFSGFIVDGKVKQRQVLGNTGVYIFKTKILEFLKPGQRSSLESDFFPDLVKQGKKVLVYKTNKEYYDVGTPDHYQEARRKIRII